MSLLKISAHVSNAHMEHKVSVITNGNQKQISIPSKSEGLGSAVNGGELLFLALATCVCNDIYREALKRNMRITSVDVTVMGNFGKEGEPGSNIDYEVKVESPHSPEEVADLISYVDQIAEVHNTLRVGTQVRLKS